MRNSLIVQDALINIFKAGFSKDSLKNVIKTIHNEIIKLIGKEKALNFYIAFHIKDDIYSIPYCVDEKDDDPINTPISLKNGLTEYIRKIKKPKLIDQKKQKELQKNGLIGLVGYDSNEWLGCPLMFKKKFYGVLSVQTYDYNVKYSNSDLKLIDFVSKNISITIAGKKEDEQLDEYKKNLEIEVSIKNKKLINTNKKLQREISKVKNNEKSQKILFNISELKNRILSTGDLVKKIHKELRALIAVENFYVAIKQGEKKGKFLFPLFEDINPIETDRENKILNIPYSFTDYVFTTQKPLLATQKQLSRIEKTTKYKMIGIKPKIWVGLPLKTKNNNILGVVTVQDYSNPKAYSKTDMRFLSLISTTIADALEFRQLEDHKMKLEKRLIEAQKMETVGIFAAGISHEFNNLLSIIIGNAHIGMVNSNPDEQFYIRFNKIIKSGEAASDLIEKLMIFTDFKKHSKYLSYNIKDILYKTITTIKEEKNSNITFDINTGDDLWSIYVDRDDMIIIFSNILSNAIDSLPGNNIINISIENFHGNIKDTGNLNKDYLLISIKDNGIGIDQGIINKIFNPFFTTKKPGKGTGLGLSMVYAIIKEHEGEIKVLSELDKGTTVNIYLPALKNKKEKGDGKKKRDKNKKKNYGKSGEP